MLDNTLKYRKIKIEELPFILPNLETPHESKESVIKKWLTDWLISSLNSKKIKESDILPSKAEISNYLGVSKGTIQNVIRYIEDEGLVQSKQKVGTMIAKTDNLNKKPTKLTSKRDKAVLAIEKVILHNNYKINRPIPSIRSMAKYTGSTLNTTRLAYEYLCSIGILESLQMRGNDSNWYLKKLPKLQNKDLKHINILQSDTIVDKLTEKLKEYLSSEFQAGNKIPSHDYLAKQFNVSIKTINDCIKRLNTDGFIVTKRGKYGTILVHTEDSNLVKITDSDFYFYKKVETKLIEYINKNFKAGDKIPSMSKLGTLYNVSTNTIRKALTNLEQNGYIKFSRGRFGGTYLIQSPEFTQVQQYQWLSINPDFID